MCDVLHPGGLFGSEWCKQVKFQENTGCELIQSQHYLLIKPAQNMDHRPELKIETSMIEDAFLKFLGAEESRCMLLYDLTKLYTKHPVDGIIQMRNPLNSTELVWANVFDLSSYSKKCFITLVMNEVYDEMHRLGCTLKVCRKSFGIKLLRCQPYVMIMGRQKRNIGEAIGFVKEGIKNTSAKELK